MIQSHGVGIAIIKKLKDGVPKEQLKEIAIKNSTLMGLRDCFTSPAQIFAFGVK